MAETRFLSVLRDALLGEARAASFAVGGRIPIKTGLHVDEIAENDDSPEDPNVLRPAEPVQIRFGESGKGFTLTLPTPSDGASTPAPVSTSRQLRSAGNPAAATSNELQHLLAACAPASFGRGGEDVHDESYRKASKLDTTEFATTFCPYNAGIMDLVQQILLPFPLIQEGNKGLRAELYKLNVYSAPSGLFKAHVDTPRSQTQIGSLVVALPAEHQGGELVVRHQHQAISKEQVFDWSQSSADPPAIQWAAFYSDCEHEVKEVTSGHRITLTYNLFATIASGHLAGVGDFGTFDPVQLPLYKTMSRALDSKSFFPGGKILAVYLTHHYAHTSATDNHLPFSLKGADMVLFEVARALCLKRYLRPLFENDEYDNSGWSDLNRSFYLLGSGFWTLGENSDNCDGDFKAVEAMHDILNVQEKWDDSKVVWLNNPKRDTEEPQAAILAYGNQASIEIKYTRAVMLIKIPPFAQRGQRRPADEEVFEGIRTPHSSDEEESRSEHGDRDGDLTMIE